MLWRRNRRVTRVRPPVRLSVTLKNCLKTAEPVNANHGIPPHSSASLLPLPFPSFPPFRSPSVISRARSSTQSVRGSAVSAVRGRAPAAKAFVGHFEPRRRVWWQQNCSSVHLLGQSFTYRQYRRCLKGVGFPLAHL